MWYQYKCIYDLFMVGGLIGVRLPQKQCIYYPPPEVVLGCFNPVITLSVHVQSGLRMWFLSVCCLLSVQ